MKLQLSSFIFGKSFISLALLASFSTNSVAADELDQARAIERSSNTASQISQKKIDGDAESVFELKAEIERMEEQVSNLTLYRDHLQKLVTSQDQEVISLESQIEGIAQTRQGVVPLMYHMLGALEHIVLSDIPVREEARDKRLTDLGNLMARADVSDAEKYRRILEAYQIEMDYGTKLGAYKATIKVSSGETRQVEVLHLGRVVLVARSLDAKTHWRWSKPDYAWLNVSADQGLAINQAFAMAEKQQAPAMVSLPLALEIDKAWEVK